MSQMGLPNLWVPRPDSYFHVEALPYLGSGKLDLRRIRELASECVQQPTAVDATQELEDE
jgi:acyl-[acyl-carrier-protein]-phospholipid O-acyltransferase/long-chain-fatty-acid--[acyl-carrier-protein] ligase